MRPVFGCGTRTCTGDSRNSATTRVNVASMSGKLSLQAASAAQRARMLSTARWLSVAISGPSEICGGSSAWAQASVLSLYDGDRSRRNYYIIVEALDDLRNGRFSGAAVLVP